MSRSIYLNPHQRFIGCAARIPSEPLQHQALSTIRAINMADTSDALAPDMLAELAEIQRKGRPEFLQRMITLYLQTAANLIKELEAASVNNEPSIFYRASHALKPCSKTIGALSLAALCEILESAARTGSVPNSRDCIEAIQNEYARVQAALKDSLPAHVRLQPKGGTFHPANCGAADTRTLKHSI